MNESIYTAYKNPHKKMPVHSVRDTQMLLQTKSMSKRLGGGGGRKKITRQPTKRCWKTQDVDTSAYMVTTRTMYLCGGEHDCVFVCMHMPWHISPTKVL